MVTWKQVFLFTFSIQLLQLYQFLTNGIGIIDFILLLAINLYYPVFLHLGSKIFGTNHTIYPYIVGMVGLNLSFYIFEPLYLLWVIYVFVTGYHSLITIIKQLRLQAPIQLIHNKIQLSLLLHHLGFVLFIVSAISLVLFRFRLTIFEIDEVIIYLTAIHFAYTGFSFIQLLALHTRFVGISSHLHLALALILTGIPIVAIGITFSQIIEVVGVIILVTGVLSVTTQLERADIGVDKLQVLLKIVAMVSAYTGMVYALLYVYSETTQSHIMSITTMLRTHAWIQSIGFVGVTLFFWVRHSNDIQI